jgi:glyoxylase I family protein
LIYRGSGKSLPFGDLGDPAQPIANNRRGYVSGKPRVFKRIDHVEIVPSDFEKSLAFYRDVLGFTAGQRHAIGMSPLREIIYLSLGDTVLELLAVENPEMPPETPWRVGYRMMAIEVEDMDDALAYLEERDVHPTWGPVDLGGTKRAEIADPDGLGIELREWS